MMQMKQWDWQAFEEHVFLYVDQWIQAIDKEKESSGKTA